MFKEKLENLRNKFTERANTLFTSMKDGEEDKDYKIDKKEKIKEKIRGLGKTKEDDEIEGELSPLVDDRTKKKYDISTEDKKEIRTKVLDNEKESRRADLLYPTMKNKEEKEEKTEENLDKIDIKKKEETKQKIEQENSVEKEEKEQIQKPEKLNGELTGSASDKKSKRSLKEVDLNDDDYEVSDNTISIKKKKEKFETINNVNFPNDTGNEKIESLKKEAKDSHSARLREDNEFYLKTHPKTNIVKLAVDNIEIPYLKKKAVKETGVEAAENLHMSKSKSYLNTDYAKQHKIYNNYNEVPIELNKYFKNKISEQIGEDK